MNVQISRRAKRLMNQFGFSTDDIAHSGKIGVKEVNALVQSNYVVMKMNNRPPTPNYSIPNWDELGESLGKREFKKDGYDFTGFSTEKVFSPDMLFDPQGKVKFGHTKGYLNFDCSNKILMQQLGRAFAQHKYGQWRLEPGFDGEDAPDTHFVMSRHPKEGAARVICAFLEMVTDKYGNEQNQCRLQEWKYSPISEWWNHKNQKTTNGMALSVHRLQYPKDAPWLMTFTKYHYLGILLSIKEGRPLGRNLEVKQGIALIGNPSKAIEHMQWGYLSELWQLSGFGWASFKTAKRIYKARVMSPIQSPSR